MNIKLCVMFYPKTMELSKQNQIQYILCKNIFYFVLICLIEYIYILFNKDIKRRKLNKIRSFTLLCSLLGNSNSFIDCYK